MILKLETFVDSTNGRQVNALSPAFPPAPKEGTLELLPAIKYTTVVPIQVQTQMGPTEIPLDINFPEGTTLKQCFEQFEDFAKKEFEAFKARMAEKQKELIVPSKGGIIV